MSTICSVYVCAEVGWVTAEDKQMDEEEILQEELRRAQVWLGILYPLQMA